MHFSILRKTESMSTLYRFKIVQFTKEKGATEVVPEEWLIRNETQTLWPSYRTDERNRLAAEKRETVRKDWKSYDIKILGTQVFYTEAIKDLNALMDQTVTDVDDSLTEEELGHKMDGNVRSSTRKGCPPPRFDLFNEADQAEVSGGSSPSPDHSLPPQSLQSPTPVNRLSQQQSQPVPASTPVILPPPRQRLQVQASTSAFRSLTRVQLPSPPLHNSTPHRARPNNDGSERDKRMFALLERISEEVRLVHQKVDQLTVRQNNGADDSVAVEEGNWPEDIILPIETVEDMKAFENRLEGDKDLRRLFVRKMMLKGGNNPEDAVARMMRLTWGKGVCKEFNFTGKSSKGVRKESFSALKTMKTLLIKAVRKNPASRHASEAFIEERVRSVLKNSKDMNGGRRERENRRTNTVRQEEAMAE
ncbi:uncharacterized protein LOC135499980 [Lineus longissimus]|uniref:uncharacterized protein LOC135499980 n=1 Tax=Lineus longissimus TaxID=88925 RepID=UPI002B4D7AE0